MDKDGNPLPGPEPGQSTSTTSDDLFTTLTQLVQAQARPTPQVTRVTLKLPEFWVRSPEVWFARVEAQFGTAGILQDETKFNHAVASLDVAVAEEIQHILLKPPTEDKYPALKAALLQAFGKTQTEKDNELLNIAGIGDRRPTALLRRIEALNDDPNTLKKALLLTNLPDNIRSILAAQPLKDIKEIAEAADRIWETKTPNNAAQAIAIEETHPTAHVDAMYRDRQPNRHKQNHDRWKQNEYKQGTHSHERGKQSDICFFHSKFGTQARNCRPGCKFAALLKRSGNGPANP